MKLTEQVMNIVADFLGKDTNGLYLKCDDDATGTYDFEGDQDIIVNFEEDRPIYLEDIIYDDDVSWRTGASKLVIIPKNFNYVIKIPFTHTYNIDENSQYYIRSKANFDICAQENDIYETVGAELRKLLVPNEFIGLYNDCIPVYIQKKISLTCSEAVEKDEYHKYRNADGLGHEIINYVCKNIYCNFDTSVLIPYMRDFGISLFIKMMKELGNLSDIHSDNWGFFKDGSIGIIDYGGYDSYDLFSIQELPF